MRADVITLLLGIACFFAGLWLIVGIDGDVNRQMREFLAVIFFITGIYCVFDFAIDMSDHRREAREEKNQQWAKDVEAGMKRSQKIRTRNRRRR